MGKISVSRRSFLWALSAALLAPLPARAAFTNGQAADLVIGQSVYNSNTPNNNPSGASLNNGGGIFVSTTLGKTFVADYSNNRVLIYHTTAPVDGASADIVLGQPDMFRNTANYGGGVSAFSLSGPISVFVYEVTGSTKLFVADYNNHRVLVWNAIPSTNTVAASTVIGQNGMNSNTASCDSIGLYNPRSLAITGGKLYISDQNCHRVKIHNAIPAVNGAAADLVLGQTILSGCVGYNTHSNCSSYANNPHNNASRDSQWQPSAVWVSTTLGKTFLADLNNNRVLIYNSSAPVLRAQADLVLGQPDWESNQCNTGGGVTAQTMCGPNSIWTDDTRLVVTDEANHRVLIWNTIPTSNQQAANVVVGQANMTSNGAASGAAQLYSPMYAWFDAGANQFFVADWNNHRVWVKNGFPASNGLSADYALGQLTVIGNAGANRGGTPDATTLRNPGGVTASKGYLWVGDTYNYRVLAYGLPITMNAQPAFRVLGQPDFVQATSNNGGVRSESLGGAPKVFASSNTLLVTDVLNHRVLVWTSSVTLDGQGADWVVGQSSFNTNTANQGGLAANTLYGWWDWPGFGVWASTDTLTIADALNNRVLTYDLPLLTNKPSARAQFGQPGFNYNDSGNRFVSNKVLYSPMGLATDGTRLFVADYQNQRVLGWDLPVTLNGQSASYVLGQASFTYPVGQLAPGVWPCNWNGTDSQSMCYPTSVWISSGPGFYHLYAGEWSNNRVKVWTTTISAIPANYNQPAQYVLGQPIMSAGVCNNGGTVTGQTLCNVSAQIWGDDKFLWVSDWSNHRILKYVTPTGSNQAAVGVIGQQNMTSNTPFSGASPFSMNSYYWSRGVVSDGNRLATVDAGNSRVMFWNSIPNAVGQGADFVLGQQNMSNNVCNQTGLSAASLCNPYGIAWDGKQFFVGDSGNNRVLVYNGWPTSQAQPADYVIGQNLFSTNGCGTGGLQLGQCTPEGLYSDGRRLWVADWSWNRVLVYDLPITANQRPAVQVLGQPGYATTGCNQGGISTNTMCNPSGVHFDGEKLYVADYNNHRVLVWNSRPTANGASADFALGQPVANANTCNNGGVTAQSLCSPASVYSDGQRLYVAEISNHRTIFWNTPPTSFAQAADGVLGRSALNVGGCCAMTANDQTYSDGVFLVGQQLWAQDNWYHRVLRYTSSGSNQFTVEITSGLAPSTLAQSTTPVAGFKLLVSAPNTALTWTRATVYNSGALGDQSIQVRLYRETNGNGVLDASLDTAISALVTMSNGKADLSFAQSLNTTQATYYIAVFVNPASLPYGPNGFPQGNVRVYHNLRGFGFAQAGVELAGRAPVGVAYHSGAFTPADAFDSLVFGATTPSLPADLLNSTTGLVLARLRMSMQNDYAYLTSLAVSKVGTSNDADVAGVTLYRDVNANGLLDAGDVNLQVSSSPFALGVAYLSPATPLEVSTNVLDYLVVADFAGSGQNSTFGITLDTSSYALHGVDIASVPGSTTPYAGAVMTLRPALPAVVNNVPTSHWWGSSFTFTGNFGLQGVNYFRVVFDQSPTHVWTDSEPLWTSGTSTQTAASPAQNWYFHARAYNATNQGGGSVDIGPFWSDVVAPVGGDYGHVSSSGGVISETQWDPLVDGVTVQATVRDANSGLAVSTAGVLTGLAGFWRMDNDWDDASGNGLTGSPSGGPAFTGEAVRGSASGQFAGAGSVSLGNPAALQITGNQTIAFWMRPTDFSVRRNPWNKAYGGEGTITQEMDGSLNYYYGQSGVNGAPYGTHAMSQNLALNQWAHVAVVRDLVTRRVRWYKNGQLTDEYFAPYPAAVASSLPALIGDGYTNPLMGQLDDMRVYGRALSAKEIGLLYNTFSVSYSTTAGNSWTVITSTLAGVGAYVGLTPASDGTTSSQTLTGYAIPLRLSTNTVVCAQSQTCQATNQVRFHVRDLAGNGYTYGPHSVLVDTPVDSATPTLTSPANGGFVTQAQPTFSWVHPSTTSFPGLQAFYLQVSSASDFSALTISQSSTVVYGAPSSFYASTTSLSAGTTYYWRVRVKSFGGAYGPYSPVFTFQTDFTGPAFSAFRHFNSTGGAFVEFQFNDLASGVTAQVRVQDALTGLYLNGSPGAETAALWQFEENTGLSSRSSSDGNNPGSMLGGTTWTAGRQGRALMFDGVNGRFSVPHAAALTLNAPFTAQVWVKPNATLSADTAFLHKGAGNFGYYLGFAGGQLVFWVANGQALTCGINAACATATVGAGSWQLITGTYDGVDLRIFLNGQELASTTYTGGVGSNTDPLVVGAYNGTSRFLAGGVDDVRLYRVVRTPAEIAAEATAASPAMAMFSNDAGWTWTVTAATYPVTPSAPYIALSGSHGTTAPQTFELRNINLVQSTSSLVGSNATNQVKFFIGDIGNNLSGSVPYGLLFDSASLTAVSTPTFPGTGAYVNTPTPSLIWRTPALASIVQYKVQVDEDPAFASPEVDVATPSIIGLKLATYTVNVALVEATTYYWRVQARTNLNTAGPWSSASIFVTDYTSPTLSSFQTFDAAGAPVLETQFNGLTAGVTAQITAQDFVSGLAAPPELSTGSVIARLEFETGLGLSAADGSGYGNHGTLSSPAIWTANGYVGGAVSVNGQYVDISTPVVSSWSGMTVAAWLRPTGTGIYNTAWASKQYQFIAYDATGMMSFYPRVTAGGGCQPVTPSSYTTSSWHHVAFVVDPGNDQNRIYVDGELAASCTGAGAPGDTRFRLGQDGVTGIGSADSYIGQLDSVVIATVPWNQGDARLEMARGGLFQALVSTTAGVSWFAVASTGPAAPRLELSGQAGSMGIEAFRLAGLSLNQSTNPLVCAGVSPCGASNQVRFTLRDRAGNMRSAGPYAILIDSTSAVAMSTASLPSQGEVVRSPSYLWNGPSTTTLSGLVTFLLEASPSATFSPLVVSIATPAAGVTAGAYISTYTLTEGATYYWRVRAKNSIGNYSPNSAVASFIVDSASPAVASFGFIGSTGGVLGETQAIDLFSGVTVQLRVQDTAGGLRTGGGFGFMYSTSAGQTWIEWASTATSLSGTGEARVNTLVSFNGQLYAGTGGGAQIHRTPDGINWSQVYTAVGETDIHAMAAFGGKLYAASGGTGKVYSTANGTVWNEVFSASGDAEIRSLAVHNGRLYAGTGNGTGKVFVTSDGAAWAQVLSGLGSTGKISMAGFAGRLFVGGLGGGLIYSTFDGISWSSMTLPDAGAVNVTALAAYDAKLWAGTGAQGKLFYSVNGASWTAGPAVAGITGISSLARHRGRLFLGADDGKLYSTDGTNTWRSFSPPGAADVRAIASFAGKLFTGVAPGANVYGLASLNESLAAAEGSTSVETLLAKDVSLVQSTNTLLCGGAAPCGATNQFRFMVSDRAGQVRSAGPYAILVDTVIAVAQPMSGQPDKIGVAVLKPEFRWKITPAISPANLTGYEFQLDTSEDFSAPVGSSFTANRYAALPFNLTNNSTYYWRVRSFDVLGASSSFSGPQSVFVDASPPTGSAFVTFDSTGGAVGEMAQQDLPAGVTAQFTLYDPGGIVRDGPTVLAPSTGTQLLWRLDDGAGLSLADSGRFGRTGTTGASPVWTNGRFGKGLRLTGLASGAASGPTIPVTAFTLQLWFNTVSEAPGWIADSDAPDYGLYLNANGTVTAYFGATQVNCAAKVNEGAWHQAAMTYDGGTGTLYLDGAFCNASAAAAPGSPGTGFALGQQASGAGPFFAGVIDEVRVFDLARSAAEVSADRDTGNPFWVRVSSDAGATWAIIMSTEPGPQPYISYTGADRDVSSQTVQVRQLTLTASTNSATCAGVAPCGASNQIRFYTSDRAGNLLEFGPYAVLVDSTLARPTAVIPADGGYLRGVTPSLGWTEAAAQYQHTVQVSTNPAFATLTFTSTTFNQYLSGGPNLTAGTTYYWRVRANSSIGLASPFSTAHSFLVDSSLPAAGLFRTVSSTGGVLAESQSNDLSSGATALLTLSDTVSGLSAAQDGSAPGALGHWRLDEGAGVTAADASGSGLSGTVSADWTAGKAGFALSVTGGQAVTVPYVPTLNTPAAMTVSAWVKTTVSNTVTDGQSVVSRWNGASGFMLNTSRPGTGSAAAFYAGIGATWLVGTRQLGDGQWHHLAATYDGATARLYVDGVLEAQRALANGLANTSTALTIGHSPNDPSAAPFTGAIDEVRLYSSARTAAQIRDDYYGTPGWYVQLSTTAGNQWTTLTSTGPTGTYVALNNGALEARGLALAQSTSSAVCGGTTPCGATNQVRFYFRDRAGNPQASGPWAVVVDAQMSQPVAGHPADGSWARRLDPILSWSEKAVMPTHVVELSTGPAFATFTYSTTTAATLAQAPSLSEGVTYYWRVKSRNAAGVDSAVSLVSAFRVDATQPDATSYRVRNATGGLVLETQFSNLALGATVQITAQDLISGLGLSSDPARGFSVSYTTNAGQTWVERSALTTVLSGTGENYIAALATFNGKLYAGTSPGAKIYSSPDGTGWSLAFSGVGDTQVQSLAVFNGKLYAGTYPNGRIYSSADGAAWSLAYSAPAQTDVRALAAFNGKLYAGTAPGGLVFTTSDGTSWQQVLGGTGENAVNALASFQGRLYAATAPNAKIYRSADGFTWSSALSGTGETEIRSLAVFSGALYAGSVPGARVYRSADGAAWSTALSGTGESAITSLAAFGGRLYAGTNPGAKLFSSADGSSWQAALANTGETYVYSMASFKGDLYAGTIPNAKVLKVSPLAAVLTGADGTVAAQTLSTPPLDLVQSTHSVTCGGVEPCAATNQVRFAVSDAAGNSRAAGPFAVLVDTSVPQPLIASLTSLTSDSIRVDMTPVVDGLSGLKDYQYYASTSNVFAAPVATSAFVPYSTFTFTGLEQVTTYYIRVVARDNLLNLSPYSLMGATSTIGVMVFSSATLAPAGTQQGTGAAMLRLTMNTVAPPSALLNKVAVRLIGGADTDLTQAELWSDADASGAWEQANDVLVAAAPVTAGQAIVDFGSNVQAVGTSPTRFFVVFRVAPTATIGTSLAARIDDNTSIGFANPYRVPGVFPATSSSTVVQDGPNIVIVDPQSSAPGTAQPNQSNIPMLRLRMRTDVGTSVLSKVVMHLTGTAASNEVAAVRIYRDNNANGSFDAADGLVTVGNDVFVSGVSTVNFTAQTSSITVSPLLQDYFVLFNMAGSANPGSTVGVKIATGSAIALTGPDTAYLTVTPGTSTLVDIVQPNMMTVSMTSQLPPVIYQGAQYSVLKATVTLDVATSKLTGVSVNRTGTGLDSDVAKVSVYLDGAPPSAGGFFNPGLAVLLGTAPFVAGRADINFAAQNLSAGTTYVYFVVYDVGPFANSGATLGGGLGNNTYIRVANPVTTIVGNFPFTSSTGTISPTVNQLLVPTALNTAPGGILQGTTNAALLRLDIRADQNAISWTSLNVEKLGTAPDSDISAVTLYEDVDANQTLDVGTDTLVSAGLDTFVAGVAALNFPLAKTVDVSSKTYFVAVSVKASAYPGNTIGVRVTTTTAFSLNSPNVVSTTTVFPLAGGPTPINQYPNVITVTTTTVAPASASPGANDLPMLKLVLRTDVSNALWQGLRVDRIGGLDADVGAVKVYYDINQIGSFNQANPAQYLLLTSTASSAFGAQGSPGTINLSFSTTAVLSPTPQTYFVVMDLSTAATPTDQIAVRLLNQNYFTVNAPNSVAPTTALSSAVAVATPPSLMYVAGASSAPASAIQGATNVPLLALKVRMGQYTAQWSGLTVVKSGSALDADISRVKVYRDANGNGALDSLLDTLVGTGTFTTGQAAIGFGAAQTVTTSTETYFVACDLSGVATANATIGAVLNGPGVFAINSPNGVVNSGFPLNSSMTVISPTQSGVFISAQDRAPASLLQGATAQVMLGLTMNTTAYTVLWNTLQVTRLGTAGDSDIAAVRVFKDNNGNGQVDAADTELTSGNDRFVSGVANILLGTPQQISVAAAAYLVAVDVYMYSATTSTFGLSLTSAAAIGVAAPNFTVNSGFPVSTSLSPLAKRPDTLATAWTNLTPSGVNQGQEVAMARFQAWALRDRVYWNQLKLLKQGTLSDGFLNFVRVYRDNGNSLFDASDTVVATGTFAAGVANLTFSAPQTMTVATQTFIVTFVFDPNSTVGATIGFSVPDASYLVLQAPDAGSALGLPFVTSSADVLDARTPTMPIVTLDGPYWKNFEDMHFRWTSSVGLGSITDVQYAIGTTPGGTQVRSYTSLVPLSNDFTAKGLTLQNGVTYYLSVRAQSSFGFISPTGQSPGILVDLVKPGMPGNVAVTKGASSILINWSASALGPSGLLGYLVEYKPADRATWLNARTGNEIQAQYVGQGLRASALGAVDLVASNSYSWTPPGSTVFVRVSAVSGSGVISPASEPIRVVFGALPKEGISEVSSYPNPFDSRKQAAIITYTLAEPSDVTLAIYSVFGGKVTEMSYPSGGNGGMQGANSVTWDGADTGGRKVPKGVYLGVISGGGAKVTHKIAVIH